MRVALATYSISHFEVPLYRLLARSANVRLKVFHILSPDHNAIFDKDYLSAVDWGEDLEEGYDRLQCADWRRMARALSGWSPDVSIQCGYAWPGALYLMLALKTLGIPLVFRGTLNHLMDPRPHRFSRLKRLLRKPLFHCFDALQCGGSYAHRALAEAGIPERRLFFVPFSVDSPHFVGQSAALEAQGARAALRAGLGIGEQDYVLLFVGQLNWCKGPDITADVFARFHGEDKSARLIIVGDGAMMGDLRSIFASAGLDRAVTFAGFQSSKSLGKYYVAADVALFSSRYETWARAVNEAMLCGCPCIVNRMMPSVDMVEDGLSGYVVDPLDTANYLTALETHRTMSREERSAMRNAARRRAWAWSYEQNLASLLQSLRYAISGTDELGPDRAVFAPQGIRLDL